MRAEQVLTYINDGDDLIVPLSNGEPPTLLDTLEAHASRLKNVRIHQANPRQDRAYIRGEYAGHLRHVAYFLSPASREAYNAGLCDLMPNDFHRTPRILLEQTRASLVLAAAAPPDAEGYFSLGTNGDYAAALIGKVPFFLEVRPTMPHTYGQNRIHMSQIEGYIVSDTPNLVVPAGTFTDKDRQIAAHVIEHIPDGSTLQVGIGNIPSAIINELKAKKHLGIHTELLTDGIVDLVAAGAIDGSMKKTHRGKIVGTFALGTQKLYDFIDENPDVHILPVDAVNDPRIIGQEDHIVAINATTAVDFYGQCASETINGNYYYSSSGGQADFARGAAFATAGKSFICLHSTTKDGKTSKITPHLAPGSVVTTSKNDVHFIATEYGAVDLRGKTVRERAKRLISIAHPKFREELTFAAKKMGL
ncbi:acetyl-CoA hydrolase/transferase family protein [Numidum massiliense]|uniref:acetyl-CoA hydrolase/transferase family protein n=1 Tax=Numidum massiliense TaxID=1522315 RepID=UPI0006D53A58|nr:acetyl-CoA hydrolase/transferase C-terminal domain-containing protein [Numidum massiliense]